MPRFDALVVDEAQDHDTAFPKALNDDGPHTDCGWWSIYFALLKDGPKAPAALFFDRAQRPPFRGSGPFDAGVLARHLSQPAFARLPHALRYTRPIYDFLVTLNAPGTERLVNQLCEPDDLPEGPEVVSVRLDDSTPEAVQSAVEQIIEAWVEDGYCQPEDILVLHTRTRLRDGALGPCESLGGLPLVEYGKAPPSDQKCIRHLSVNRAKGLDSLAVILVGVKPFAETNHTDSQYTYFMGASRAKQLLGIVHG